MTQHQTPAVDPRIAALRARGAHIGDHVFMGADVYIEQDFAPLLIIEDGVVLSRGVAILLHDSALNNLLGEPVKFGPVILRRNCYLGVNALVLCGVTVGPQALVGAGAIVTHDVPAETVAYGQPARVHGTIHELAARHRQTQHDERFSYLPLTPWRERYATEEAAQAESAIQIFLDAQAQRIHAQE